MQTKVTIASSADENYARGLILMLASFIHANKKLEVSEVEVIILDGGLSEETKEVIAQLPSQQHAAWPMSFRFHKPDLARFDKSPKLWGKSNLTLARLDLGDLTTEPYLYWIDSDFIVNKELPPVSVLGGKTIAGCQEPHLPYLRQDFPEASYDFGEADFMADTPYINAGFMLMNLDRWRQLGFGKKMVDAVIACPSDFKWLDQSAINFFARDEITIIDRSYNYNVYDETTYPTLKNDWTSFNLHLTGKVKPWMIRKKSKTFFLQNIIFLMMEEKLLKRVNTAVISMASDRAWIVWKVTSSICNPRVFAEKLRCFWCCRDPRCAALRVRAQLKAHWE